MRMLHALRSPAIALLWFGQAFSAVGDEIYRVALTWIAVGIVGADAGYLGAGQSAALMLLSLFGGHWADHWQPLKTMIRTDLFRAAIVLAPVLLSRYMQPNMVIIWIVAIPLAALGAFFEPALQSVLPRYASTPEILKAANGLMGTTFRIARLVGPLLVGLLASFIPMIHFFSLDAISFIISAICVLFIRKLSTPNTSFEYTETQRHTSFFHSLGNTYKSICREKNLRFVFLSKALTGCTWTLLILSLTLLIRDLTSTSAELFSSSATKTYGLVIASYGLGNLGGVLFFGNLPRHRSYLTMYSGYAFFSLGFFAVALAPSVSYLMLACAFAGFFGPMNDLGFIDLMQKLFPFAQMAKVFRFRIAVETGATLLLMLCSPFLLKHFAPRPVIFASGVVWISTAIAGFIHRGGAILQVEAH